MAKPKKEDLYAERLKSKLAALKPASGCYLFRDAKGTVVYVGKAKSLRARVRSYFTGASSDDRYFIPILRQVVTDLETIVTASEKEAAVLENELIKQNQPRFNVKLRDDKDFLCLRLDARKPWPRLETARRPSADGARYFGPYHSASSARRTLHLVNKHFHLRTCSDSQLRSRKRACLQYQIKRCPGPCVYEVDAEHYGQQVRSVELFLDARQDELTGELTRRMTQASADLEYELAARYRDQLRAVESILERQRVVAVRRINQDVVGLFREGGMLELVVMILRQGHVIDTRSFSLGPSELPDEEIVAGFLTQYYASDARSGILPDELVLPVRPDAVQGLADWLSDRRGKKVRAVVPQKGPRRKLLDLANENAAHAFREKQRASDEIDARLEQLRAKLRLSTLPRVIECCDISHLAGSDTVGAVVCLRDGQPDKQRYRSFRIRTTDVGDDYAAMYEVLARRFRRGRTAAQMADHSDDGAAKGASAGKGSPGEWELPDLFVVDGGRGQLGVALAAARDLGLHDLAIVGLAKERETATGDKLVDRVYLPGQMNPVSLRSTSASLHFLASARDEAHRFANRGRKQAGRKRQLRSELDDIRGIGPVARQALLSSIGSMKAIRGASDDQLLAVGGFTRRHLTALRKVVPAPE
ncbi:MAG: excinuclease ABC subunit UvrC [Deltaproteobacteria bacterium]|nr:excinuclease ABC subunit UvrC [Deltaproteobacteria bacterium]